jgi:hypothetical protein
MMAALFVSLLIMSLLNVVSWNVRGVMHGTPTLVKLMEHSDVMFLAEHWLNECTKDFLETVDPNFHAISRIRSDSTNSVRGCGGVAFMIRRSDRYTVKDLITDNEGIIGIQLCLANKESIYILGTHMPSSNPYILNICMNCLNCMMYILNMVRL